MLPDVVTKSTFAFWAVLLAITCGVPELTMSIASVINGMSNSNGNVTVFVVVPEAKLVFPPWVQDGNDADPDERHGSFTENRQKWKRCPDAG